MMNFRRLVALAPVAALLSLASAGAHAVIVDIDAQSPAGTTVTLNPGTYTLTWAGVAGGGKFDGWQYNNADSGNFRDAFTVSVGPFVRTYDRNDGNVKFTNYATASAALADFQAPTGTSQYIEYGTASDSAPTGNFVSGPLTFTLAAPVTATFSVPDNLFSDNKGGVSLAITAAVPEPGTYALMLAGIAAVGVAARRSSRQPRG